MSMKVTKRKMSEKETVITVSNLDGLRHNITVKVEKPDGGFDYVQIDVWQHTNKETGEMIKQKVEVCMINPDRVYAKNQDGTFTEMIDSEFAQIEKEAKT